MNSDSVKLKYFERLNDDLVQLFITLNKDMNEHSPLRVKFGEDCFHDAEAMTDFVIAYDGKKPVGCAILRKHSKEVGILTNIYVAPDYRSSGLVYRMFDAIESKAKERGHLMMIGDTWNELIPMQKAWHKGGYAEYIVASDSKEEKAYYAAGKNYWKLLV